MFFFFFWSDIALSNISHTYTFECSYKRWWCFLICFEFRTIRLTRSRTVNNKFITQYIIEVYLLFICFIQQQKCWEFSVQSSANQSHAYRWYIQNYVHSTFSIDCLCIPRCSHSNCCGRENSHMWTSSMSNGENFEMQQPPVCSVSVLAISKCIKNYSRYGIIYGFQVHVYYTLQNSHQWNITLFIVIRNTKAGRIFCVWFKAKIRLFHRLHKWLIGGQS